MAMGYVDCPYLLTLDLPGGKRHLGESTLRGVIREVEEKCSFAIDYEYLECLIDTVLGLVQQRLLPTLL